MKKTITFLVLFISFFTFSQIKGTVTDEKGNPMPFVNIYIKDTYNSTTTNDLGKYEINIKTKGTYVVLYQYLGYKTEKQIIQAETFPYYQDVRLTEENIELNEVVINAKNNPADEIIKNAIKFRKENSAKTAKYKADFYSRGIFRVKNLPEKILGQKMDFFDDIIDSTRSGILYLSETVSKIAFQKPDKMKEIIVASKVSGKDNGFSFNSANQANFDFYENYLEFNTNVISPIADNAFNYYKYKFEGSFVDENNSLINKIKVIAKRDTEPVMEGYIYIVDNGYNIYAVDLSVSGKQIQNPALNTLSIKQGFSFNTVSKIWTKNTQTLDFDAGMMGVKISGKFTYVYSNFEFPAKFDKKTFTAEVIKFEENANKKEDAFWETIRPVPLTNEETNDYIKKDKLQEKKKSKVYLDSIDNKRNKFTIIDIATGYSYENSFKKWSINYDGPLTNTSFNTVQGWNSKVGLSFTKNNDDQHTFYQFGANASYGLSDKKFRPTAFFNTKLNNNTKSYLTVFGGSEVNQFNPDEPITKIVNSISTLFFRNNFMKLFERNYVAATFSRSIINGLRMDFGLEYAERKPLYNTTDYSIFKSNDVYSSNNPLLPNDFITPVIVKHNLALAKIAAKINFNQKYITRPDGKYSYDEGKYPTLYINYKKGFAGNIDQFDFDQIELRATHNFMIGNKGEIRYNTKAGAFSKNNISFVDYKHFNGNLTHFTMGDYLNRFNNLPYYTMSTNKSYFETHTEYNDKGFIMNKIPLLNKLQSKMILGFKNLATSYTKPYQEFSIGLENLGFGKYRILRIDYVRSYQNGYQGDAVIFGLNF